MRMMVWWKPILISEYSSRCARTAPFSKVANMLRSDAMSSSLALSVIKPRRHAFQRRPGGDQLDHLAPGLAHHIDAAPRHRAHETLALELRHGLAHRRPADAELMRQAALVEPDLGTAPVNVHRGDGVLERGIGLALETRRVGERIDGKPRRRQLRRTRGNPPQYGETRTHRWHTIFQQGQRRQRSPGLIRPAASIPYKWRPRRVGPLGQHPLAIQPGDPARLQNVRRGFLSLSPSPAPAAA